ncbi:MAG: MFS transporter [Sporolactobacillus sp.]
MRLFTLASCALYFLTGLTSISIGSVLPELLRHYQLSYTIGGQMIFIGAMGFLSGVLLTSWLNRRFPPRPLLALSALVIAAAQFSLLFLPPFPVFVALFFINSVGSASIGIVVATLFINVFIGRQAVAMSYLEVAFGLGSFLMPLLASGFISLGIWRFLFLINAVLAAFLAYVWTRVPYAKQQRSADAAMDASGATKPIPLSARKRLIVLALFALSIFLYGGLEGSLNNFMSSIFIHFLHQAAWFASLSVGVFWGSMVIGRAITGWIIRKVTYSLYLRINMSGAILSLVLFILLKNAWLGFAFVAILGLMMSGIYSITLVFANYSIPDSANTVTPIISGLSGLGSAIFPAFTGFSIDRFGIQMTLWYIVGIAAGYLIFLIVIDLLRNGRLPRLRFHSMRYRAQ